MDADLKSIAAARRCAESAFAAYQAFLGTDPKQVDAIVDAMARAIEPEAERLGVMAVEETGYGNVPDKRVKNLFNALSVADYLRDITVCFGMTITPRSRPSVSPWAWSPRWCL
jgi:acetaldehyde dehydrogenase (acetylating)